MTGSRITISTFCSVHTPASATLRVRSTSTQKAPPASPLNSFSLSAL